MESLLWHLTNRTAETQFIFNLFHILLAGLTLLVLLHQIRAGRAEPIRATNRLLALGFLLLVLHFALLALRFGAEFFFRKEFDLPSYEILARGLMTCGVLLAVAALPARDQDETALRRRGLQGCAVVVGIVLVRVLLPWLRLGPAALLDSFTAASSDVIAALAIGFGIWAVFHGAEEGRRANLLALGSMGVTLFLHWAPLFAGERTGILLWNAEEHVLSVSLFAFAWAAGERSHNLLDRIFVRLNLTFIVLASLIMLVTASMEKYQYLRMAEERSMDLAEFLRGHIVYYRNHGERLEDVFRHPDVLRRVVVEFGRLPELREVSVYLDGRRASFHSTPDWEIKEEIVTVAAREPPGVNAGIPNSFQMIRLPLDAAGGLGNRIEFVGTMDLINTYIGRYIILIYSLFTVMVALASIIVGIIVNDADRRLRQQYAELRNTQQQLAQAAKLASVGQLAGGTAHEINNPVTSILSLASHLAKEENAGGLSPRNRKSLQVIVQQAERVSRIVGNLLTFARQSSLDMNRVDVAELLDTATAMVEYRLRDHGIRLSREIDPHLPPAMGDAGRLTEVFVNLFSNAIDAMPGGGQLVVRASSDGELDDKIRVEVKDSGQGISPEHLPRIFDPFFTTKEPGRGTGLGLSISHGIVKDHGGQIWAESQPGTGTRLVILLPTGGTWE